MRFYIASYTANSPSLLVGSFTQKLDGNLQFHAISRLAARKIIDRIYDLTNDSIFVNQECIILRADKYSNLHNSYDQWLPNVKDSIATLSNEINDLAEGGAGDLANLIGFATQELLVVDQALNLFKEEVTQSETFWATNTIFLDEALMGAFLDKKKEGKRVPKLSEKPLNWLLESVKRNEIAKELLELQKSKINPLIEQKDNNTLKDNAKRIQTDIKQFYSSAQERSNNIMLLIYKVCEGSGTAERTVNRKHLILRQHRKWRSGIIVDFKLISLSDFASHAADKEIEFGNYETLQKENRTSNNF